MGIISIVILTLLSLTAVYYKIGIVTVVLLIILSLTALLAVLHYSTSGRKYWFNKKVPYREPCPIFGNFGATLLTRQTYTKTLQDFYDRYRDEKFVGIFQARRPVLMLTDLEIVKSVLVTEFNNFSDRGLVMTDTKREPLLRNLSNMSGPEWKAMRHIVTPTFSSAKMKAMFPLVTECAIALKNVLLQESADDVNVPLLMTRYTTDVIGSCAFGVDVGSLKDTNSPFLLMSQKMFKMTRSAMIKRYCRSLFPRIFKLLNLKTYSPDVEHFITNTITQVLNERRKTGVVRNDIIQLMLNVQKTETCFQITDELIISNSFIFMLAGLETSATTLSFCLYQLAKDQDLQELVRKEIQECLSKHDGLTYDAVAEMRFTTLTILETLRMHPPSPMTMRLCTSPCTLPHTDLKMKEKDIVLIPIQSIHRDPEHFPEPDKFDPERFSENQNPPAFMAFGQGPRACIGARLGNLMVAAGLAAMLSTFTVEPCARTTPQIEYDPRSVMLKNKGGIWLKFSPLKTVLESEILENLKQHDFLETYLNILVDFCNEKAHDFNLEPNVPRSILERRNELEVRAQKCGDVYVSPRCMPFHGRPPPSPALVAAAADVVFNVSTFANCPIQDWNERGLFRLLFRCASWSKGSPADVYRIRLSTCRALAAAATHKCVRSTLATTKDCLLALLATLKPLEDEVTDSDKVAAQAQVLMLLATLIPDKTASDILWRALAEARATAFFCCLLQGLECDEIELQDAALHCLTQLAQSAMKKSPDQKPDNSRVKFLDNLKSPFTKDPLSDRQGSGDKPDDCQPEYMVEELCKVLIHLYTKLEVENRILTNLDERWHLLSSCLSSLLASSSRSRLYGVHRQLPRVLLTTLQSVRDRLSLQGSADVLTNAAQVTTYTSYAAHKSLCAGTDRLYGVHRQLPRVLLTTLQSVRDRLSLQGSADVLTNAAQNPTLRTLQWLLVLIDCHMVECPPAKEIFADDGLSVSLARLWAWCMLAQNTRDSVAHLLFTFTNDCPKAWGAMSSCIGGRSLAGEVCALVCREASLQTRPRSDNLLLLSLKTLRHIVPHHHCRTIILKSEAVTSMYKLRVRERGISPAACEWARLCEALSRHADGAGALLALRPILTAPAVRALLMPALAHVARHRRAAVLQARDLLELLSGTLLAGDTAEVVSATRAVWALAANNHKAKLLLRSAGVAAAVQSALQRFHRLPADSGSQRAVQLLLYTNSILQTT
ncbi:cytochrome p450 domain-containing protein [Phthorimaea operculella]|nr:cytochrome p450 domain-containing protein [Phthorimaea operculella]